MWKALGEELCL
jgi:hypothetical protein